MGNLSITSSKISGFLTEVWFLSLLSFPPTAVIRSTSRLWVSTVCPPPWFCPPAPRNPELPAHLTQLLTGHRTRTPPGGSEEIWILKLSTRNHVVFWCCRLTGKTGKFGGLWEPFTSGTESQSSLRSQFVKRWRCRSLRTPLLSAESRCINPRLSTRTRRWAENRTHLETARWRDFFSSSTEGFRVVCF